MADRDDYDDESSPKKKTKRSGLDTLQMAFAIVGCSGLIFYINGPAKNENQALFRLGVMGVGLVGLVVVTMVKLATRRRM